MLPPSVVIQRGGGRGGRSGALRWRGAGERTMNAMGVVIVPEFTQLAGQVHAVPEEHAVEVLAPDRSDQPFDERMGDRSVRNRLDFLNLEDGGLASQRWKRNSGSWSVLMRLGRSRPATA